MSDLLSIDAVLSADVERVSRGPARLRSGRLSAHAWGKPNSLSMDANLAGRGFEAGSLVWSEAVVTLRGPVQRRSLL